MYTKLDYRTFSLSTVGVILNKLIEPCNHQMMKISSFMSDAEAASIFRVELHGQDASTTSLPSHRGSCVICGFHIIEDGICHWQISLLHQISFQK
jgi:hypothetical protein